MKYDAILFDLDGTLLDSAPDLVHTLNDLLDKYQRPRVSVAALRQYVSQGSARLLELGFDGDYPLPFEELRGEYLQKYQQQNTVHSDFFAGIPDLLDKIEATQTPWAIITNKWSEPTQPIATHFALDKRAAAIVCGDTLPVAKPDPSPLFLACEMMGVNAENCVYIGDAKTDIEAGKNAGMATIACNYGYLLPNCPIETWGTDSIVEQPDEIFSLIH